MEKTADAAVTGGGIRGDGTARFLARKGAGKVVLLMIGLIAALGCTAETPARPPNIVFILADDMGYSDLGCYGGEIETPNLDALAAGGLRFTQFYNTTRCWPTRAALLTGYYAQQVRRDVLPGHCGGGVTVRPEWAPLLPDLLEPAGYRSYHSGKWHIDGKVLDGGFHRSLDMRNDGNFFTAKGNFVDDQPIEPAADESGYYATVATVDHALDVPPGACGRLSRSALLSLHRVHCATLSPPCPAPGHRALPGPVPGRLGRHAPAAFRPAERDGTGQHDPVGPGAGGRTPVSLSRSPPKAGAGRDQPPVAVE